MRLILLALILAQPAAAAERDCLAQIMYSEARGESVHGVVAIAQATIKRSKKQKTSVCKTKGVSRKTPPKNVQPFFLALADTVIDSDTSIVGDADSWNTGTKPAYRGNITKVIGHHVFYTQN